MPIRIIAQAHRDFLIAGWASSLAKLGASVTRLVLERDTNLIGWIFVPCMEVMATAWAVSKTATVI